MKTDSVHIVSFDVPYPADYGGAIDVYYKCKSLTESGIKVILHCYEYGRGKQSELETIAEKVYYYQRKKTVMAFFSKLPFIVETRKSKDLLNNLLKDNFPILFEGIHTTYFLNHPSLKNRIRLVRAHNVEHDYYKKLAEVETNFLKKIFFKTEARKLEKYEPILESSDEILALTEKDLNYFKKKYRKGVFIPVFSPLNTDQSERNVGNYALYHGNLSVGENEFALRYLVNEVWEKDFPLDFIAAGKNPSDDLIKFLKERNIKCIINPNHLEMNQLIRNAKINLLPTFQSTGIKLKLINSLSNGGFCLANSIMLEGTGLEKFCYLADTPQEWKNEILKLADKNDDNEVFEKRKSELQKIFNGRNNAKKIIEIIKNIKK